MGVVCKLVTVQCDADVHVGESRSRVVVRCLEPGAVSLCGRACRTAALLAVARGGARLCAVGPSVCVSHA